MSQALAKVRRVPQKLVIALENMKTIKQMHQNCIMLKAVAAGHKKVFRFCSVFDFYGAGRELMADISGSYLQTETVRDTYGFIYGES